jgi:CRP-like cAMP-binding protein
MYLIVSGSAALIFNNNFRSQETIGIILAGEFFGEKASLMNQQTSDISVKALEELQVLFIDRVY